MKLEDLIEKHRFSEIPRYLEKHRAEAEQTDAFLRTPLHRLCEQGRRRGSNAARRQPSLSSPRSSSSSSSSHDDDAVVLRDMAKATEALLDAYPGALTSTDEDGRTPLHCACIATPRAEPMIVKILLREFVRIATKSEKQTDRKKEEECSSGINTNTPLLSATKSMRRSRTRGQRNTPLHELCQWGDWSSTITTTGGEDPELEVLRLLLRVDPLGGLARNRSGITPLNLVFGERYRSLSARELSDVVRYNNSSGSGNNSSGTNHEKNHELHREFPRRWRAVEALVRAAAAAGSTTTQNIVATGAAAVSGTDAICDNARHPYNNTNEDFLFLHATLNVDRTFPIFDVVVQKYGSLQSRIRGTERGNRCDDAQHPPRTDYPLAIAARSPMFAYGISDSVIRSLVDVYPEAASLPTSSGRTVLLEAIYGGKGFASRYDENNNNHNHNGRSSLAAKKNDAAAAIIGATGPLGSILRAYPGAINIPDRGNGLHPFAVAASIDRNKKEKQFCCASIATEASDVFTLNNSYTLLRMAPHLLLLAAVQEQEEQDSD